MQLTGNTILITGGSTGIGFELAKALLDKGNTVVITGRNAGKLKAAKQQLPAVHTIRSDVSDPKQVDALYKKVAKQFPTLNVLINNAGIMWTINLHDHKLKAADLTKEIDVNLKGPIWMTDRFLPLLKNNADAAVVNVSSGLAFVPLPISPVYCATKAALHSWSLSLRVQLKHANIKVFELAPPATETELLSEFNEEDMKDISIMPVDAMVADFMRGFERDDFEIRPGQANQLKFMSRLAPGFILNMMSKPVDRMLSGQTG